MESESNVYIVNSSSEENKIAIYNESELYIKKENELESKINDIYDDEYLINIRLNGGDTSINNISEILINDNIEVRNWFNKKNWENLFWLIGYNINKREKPEIINDIKEKNLKEILLYLQTAEVVLSEYNKGIYIKRLRDLYNNYFKKIQKEEPNKSVVEMILMYRKDWEKL